MSKKKPILIVLILTLLSFGLSAGSMRSFTTSSQEWKAASALCISNGVLPPTSVSPMTGSEIEAALARIPESRLDENEKSLRDKIVSRLGLDPVFDGQYVDFDPAIILSPEIYAQTTKLERQWDHLYDIKDMMSPIDLSLDLVFADFGFAFADYYFISPGLKSQYGNFFGTNMDSLNDFQHEGILNCGMLLGTDFLYAGVFRTRQSMGYGKTGNLMVGDNFSRQDFMRMKVESEYFDYALNFTHFDQSELNSEDNAEVSIDDTKFNGMHQIQGVHRFEVKIADCFQFTFQEGTMMNISSPFDFRFLNPFIYFHGLYNFSESDSYEPGKSSDEANNYITVELGYTATSHLRFNMQFLIDQIQIGGERYGDDACPNAFGLLLNVESPWILDGASYLSVWYESVFMMPYAYLNKKLQGNEYNTNLDMITGYHNALQDEIGYAGYTYGSDSIVNAIGLDYGKLGVFDLSASFTYLIHGRYGYGYQTIIPPRGEDSLDDMPLVGVGLSGAEHRLIARMDGSYYPLEGLELRAGIGLVQVFNLKTEKGRNLTDLQLKIGISFDPVTMFAK